MIWKSSSKENYTLITFHTPNEDLLSTHNKQKLTVLALKVKRYLSPLEGDDDDGVYVLQGPAGRTIVSTSGVEFL